MRSPGTAPNWNAAAVWRWPVTPTVIRPTRSPTSSAWPSAPCGGGSPPTDSRGATGWRRTRPRSAGQADPRAGGYGRPPAGRTADRVRVRHRAVDGRTVGGRDGRPVRRPLPPERPVPLSPRPRVHPAEAGAGAAGAGLGRHRRVAGGGVAADRKSVRRRKAEPPRIDESGLLVAPLVRRTWALRGGRPQLLPKGRHREKGAAAGGGVGRRQQASGRPDPDAARPVRPTTPVGAVAAGCPHAESGRVPVESGEVRPTVPPRPARRRPPGPHSARRTRGHPSGPGAASRVLPGVGVGRRTDITSLKSYSGCRRPRRCEDSKAGYGRRGGPVLIREGESRSCPCAASPS